MVFHKPNAIAQTGSGSNDNKSLKVRGFRIGLDQRGAYGPTSATRYWMGISPPQGGYVTYRDKSLQGPSIQICYTDQQLIDYANKWGSQSYTTIEEALNYFRNISTREIAMNVDYPSIILKNLILCFDSGFIASYSKGGNTWYDLSYTQKSCTFTNGVQFIEHGLGYLSFDGSTSLGSFSNFGYLSNFTVEVWVRFSQFPANYVNNPAIIFEEPLVDGESNFFIGFDSSGNLVCGYGLNNTLYLTSGFVPSTNEWYQIAMTYDGLKLRQYRDGQEVDAVVPAAYLAGNSATDVVLGKEFSSNGRFKIEYYNIKIYNHLLSRQSIKDNYNAHGTPLGVIYKNLLIQLDAYNILSSPDTCPDTTKWKSTVSKDEMDICTVYNSPTYLQASGGILEFDGQSQYVQLPMNFISPYDSTKQFTINIWFKTPNNKGTLFGEQDNSTPGTSSGVPAIYIDSNGKLVTTCFYGGNTSNVTVSSSRVDDNNWHNVVVTYSGTTQTTYIDNFLIGTLSKTQTNYGGSNKYYFLCTGYSAGYPNSNGDYFEGRIGYFAVYNKLYDPSKIDNYSALKFRYE